MADYVPHLCNVLPLVYEYRTWAKSEQLGICFKRHTLRRPVQTHAARKPVEQPSSSCRRLWDRQALLRRRKEQVVQFQISGPTHVNHESIMQIAEFESGK